MTDRSVDADDGEGGDDAESRWRFSLEDIEQREAETKEAEAAERQRAEPVEAGSPSLENTAFVLLGVIFALFVLSRLVV
jgi:hypothetical protein